MGSVEERRNLGRLQRPRFRGWEDGAIKSGWLIVTIFLRKDTSLDAAWEGKS